MKKEILESLIECQKTIGILAKDQKNPFFNSKYVPLSTVLQEVKPVLNENGFYLSQEPQIEGGQDVLTTRLIHISGEEIKCTTPLKKANDNDPQKYGSAITYMRRYSLCALLGIAEQDDDANSASNRVVEKPKHQPAKSYLSPQQVKELEQLLELHGKDKIEFCKLAKIDSLNQLTTDRFVGAKQNIINK